LNIYALSGLGANELVFEHIEFPDGYNFVFLPWLIPMKEEGIRDYALRMAEQIDAREEFILMGLSFGGILAQEIARIKKPQKLLLFSTVCSEREKPFWIRINKYLKLYKIFPYSLLNQSPLVTWFSELMQFVDPKRPNLMQLYTIRDNSYTRWAFEQIVHWSRTYELSTEVHRFHGKWDVIFPIWNIERAQVIDKAGHLAVYTAKEQINKLLREIL